MRKNYVIYIIISVLIVASWLGNIVFNSYYRLPEAKFLQHHIEVTDVPSVGFDLLYVANKADKQKIQSIQVAELPTLNFYPVQVHQELNRQTIYQFKGYYRSVPDRKTELPPLNIHAVTVTFNDGTSRVMDVGDIIVYRNAYPSTELPTVEFSSGGGSSDGTGFNSVNVKRPAALIGTTSAWLDLLGSAFQFDEKISRIVGSSDPHESEVSYPLKLEKGDTIQTHYGFKFPDNSPLQADVFNLRLTQTYEDEGGKRSSYPIFANYLPYFKEAQMKDFVRLQREDRE